MKILAINPGSTSTKIALFEDEECLWTENIPHPADEIAKFSHLNEQLPMRRELVLKALSEKSVSAGELSAICARGGLLPPIKSGAYEVDEALADTSLNRPVMFHASNLAAPIGYEIGRPAGVPVYIYDAVTCDEMLDIARVTGLKEISRRGLGHNLNCRAAFMEYARLRGKRPADVTACVVHLGGGITVAVIRGGRIIDIQPDDEGPFSAERAGGLPIYSFMEMAISCKWDKASLLNKLRAQGGLMAYFGTTDIREVERRIDAGDVEAAFIYEAMALNIARNIAKMAAIVSGKVEATILTGGMAHSKRLTDMIEGYAGFVAPVEVIPGENEMRALALGALRVLRGEESARVFKDPRD